jgi:hypothetical protein
MGDPLDRQFTMAGQQLGCEVEPLGLSTSHVHLGTSPLVANERRRFKMTAAYVPMRRLPE